MFPSLLNIERRNLSQIHDVQHIINHSVNLSIPTVMEMSVEPMAEGMALEVKMGMEVVHYLALMLDIAQQVFVLHGPVV